MVRMFAVVVLAACSPSKDKAQPAPGSAAVAPAGPSAPAAPAAPAGSAADDSPRALCTRGCAKLISCAGVSKDELASCVDTCAGGAPQKAQIEQLEGMTCEQIAASGAMPEPAGSAAAPAK